MYIMCICPLYIHIYVAHIVSLVCEIHSFTLIPGNILKFIHPEQSNQTPNQRQTSTQPNNKLYIVYIDYTMIYFVRSSPTKILCDV